MESLTKTDKNNPRPMQQWSFITALRSTPTTAERPSTFRPDGFFYRKGVPNPESYSYYDIAFTVEFKKRGKGTNSVDVSPFTRDASSHISPLNRPQYVSKVVYEMKHIMAVDARRRFTFGITIENDKMGL